MIISLIHIPTVLLWSIMGLLVIIAGCMGYFFCRAKKRAIEKTAELEKKIEELEFEKKLLMRGQDTVLLVLDSKGEITLTNRHALKLFDTKDLLGRKYEEALVSPEIVLLITEAVQKGEPIKKEVLVNLESSAYEMGEERNLFVSIKFLEDGFSERFTRIYIQDNTDQYRADQIRKDFLANASHELRTPLAIINGYVETLMDDTVLSDQETSLRFLKVMKKHGSRLARIIEEMLIISKLESGVSNVLKISPFRLGDCIEDCLVNLDPIIKERNTKMKVKMDEPHLSIEADRFYWNQILFNLVENAIKQNVEKSLTIEISCQQCKETGAILIQVSDDGVGIPATDLPFIFRRFYRVEKHHSQNKIKGTGLGLSIVKRAVEAHGGEIQCDSIQDQMTRFSITLPAAARTEDIVM